MTVTIGQLLSLIEQTENQQAIKEVIEYLSQNISQNTLPAELVNADPLTHAIEHGNLPIVRHILQNKELRNTWLRAIDCSHKKPLFIATKKAIDEPKNLYVQGILDLLLQYPGLDVNSKTADNRSPLEIAQSSVTKGSINAIAVKSKLEDYHKITTDRITIDDIRQPKKNDIFAAKFGDWDYLYMQRVLQIIALYNNGFQPKFKNASFIHETIYDIDVDFYVFAIQYMDRTCYMDLLRSYDKDILHLLRFVCRTKEIGPLFDRFYNEMPRSNKLGMMIGSEYSEYPEIAVHSIITDITSYLNNEQVEFENGDNLLHQAIRYDRMDIIYAVLVHADLFSKLCFQENSAGLTPINLAEKYQTKEVAQYFLEYSKLSQNSGQNTLPEELLNVNPLTYAIFQGNLPVVRQILGDEQSRDSWLRATNRSHGEPLLIAVKKAIGELKNLSVKGILDLLLQYPGLDVNSQTADKPSPLEIAQSSVKKQSKNAIAVKSKLEYYHIITTKKISIADIRQQPKKYVFTTTVGDWGFLYIQRVLQIIALYNNGFRPAFENVNFINEIFHENDIIFYICVIQYMDKVCHDELIKEINYKLSCSQDDSKPLKKFLLTKKLMPSFFGGYLNAASRSNMVGKIFTTCDHKKPENIKIIVNHNIRADIIKYLNDEQVEFENGDNLLHQAIRYERMDIIYAVLVHADLFSKLCSQENSAGLTPINLAEEYQTKEVAQFFLGYSEDISGTDACIPQLQMTRL